MPKPPTTIAGFRSALLALAARARQRKLDRDKLRLPRGADGQTILDRVFQARRLAQIEPRPGAWTLEQPADPFPGPGFGPSPAITSEEELARACEWLDTEQTICSACSACLDQTRATGNREES